MGQEKPTNKKSEAQLHIEALMKVHSVGIWEEIPVGPKEFFEKWLGTPAYPIQEKAIADILVEEKAEIETPNNIETDIVATSPIDVSNGGNSVNGEKAGRIAKPTQHWRRGIYNESYLLWGEGSGKDWTSSRMMAYAIYWLLCLKNPQAYFGMADPKASIDLVNISFDEAQAQFVYFKELKKSLASTIDPNDGKNWFEKKGMKIKESSKQQVIEFPKYVTCYSLNSKEYKIEGKGCLMAVFDEMAVFKTTHAEELYKNLINNMRSRFPDAYKFIALSYKRDDYDFMMVRWDQTKDNPRVYRSHHATWEVNPTKTRAMLQESYDYNPEDAERRFECKGKTSKEGYFKYRDQVKNNSNIKRTSPIIDEEIPVRNLNNLAFYDWFTGNGYAEYAVHIDLGSGKEGNDCAGFAIGHRIVDPVNEEQFQVYVDLMCQLKAEPGKEIIFDDIRTFIYSLINQRRFNIVKVTLDGWQSMDFIQQLKSKGINADILSVDRDNIAYDTLKGLIYQNRIDYYFYPVFLRECEELITIGGKVDHPVISRRRALEEKDERGSKDVSDAVAAICRSLYEVTKTATGPTKWLPLEGGDDIADEMTKGQYKPTDPNQKNVGKQYDDTDDGVNDDS